MSDTKFPVVSEEVEPAIVHILGRLWAQVEEAEGEFHYEDRLQNLSFAVDAINKLAICCNQSSPGATHFSIAAGNMATKVGYFVEKFAGFNPFFERKHEDAKFWRWV